MKQLMWNDKAVLHSARTNNNPFFTPTSTYLPLGWREDNTPRYTLKDKVIFTCRNIHYFYPHKYSTDVDIRRKHLKSHKTATHFIIYLQSLCDYTVFSYSSALVSCAQH